MRAMSRDDYERHLAQDQPGLYESHYIKANSNEGHEAFWIKHNLLVPPGGGGIAEFWFIWFRRGEAPWVGKREVPVGELTLSSTELALRGDRFRLGGGGRGGRTARGGCGSGSTAAAARGGSAMHRGACGSRAGCRRCFISRRRACIAARSPR